MVGNPNDPRRGYAPNDPRRGSRRGGRNPVDPRPRSLPTVMAQRASSPEALIERLLSGLSAVSEGAPNWQEDLPLRGGRRRIPEVYREAARRGMPGARESLRNPGSAPPPTTVVPSRGPGFRQGEFDLGDLFAEQQATASPLVGNNALLMALLSAGVIGTGGLGGIGVGAARAAPWLARGAGAAWGLTR